MRYTALPPGASVSVLSAPGVAFLKALVVCSASVNRLFASLVLAVVLAMGALAAEEVGEQTVTPIAPQVEQRVEGVTPGGEQRVEAVGPEGLQGVSYGSKGPVRRSAELVGKVVIGVLAASIAIGTTVASLLFI